MKSQIQIRRGTASQWSSTNPVLNSGEIGLETDTNNFKIGNGVTSWNNLLYTVKNTLNIDEKISSYTLQLSDNNKTIEMKSSSANTVTIPDNSTVSFPIGSSIDIVQTGTGQTEIIGNMVNGATWTTQTSNFDSTTIRSIEYGNGIWVAGGDYGNIRSSTDAITWTTRTPGDNDTIYSIKYGNGKWVVGTQSGYIQVSTNLTSWSTYYNVMPTPVKIYSIEYGNGTWSAFGGYGLFTRSTDAVSWVAAEFPPLFGSWNNPIKASIEYGNGIWVAGGFAEILTSTDSISWSPPAGWNGFGAFVDIHDIKYNDGIWVAVCSSGTIRTSTDTVSWTGRTSNFGNTSILSLSYGNNLWVAGGYGGQIRTSTDAITWTTRTSNFGSTIIQSVAYGNNLWVAGGYAGQVRTSTETMLPTINSKDGNKKLSSQYSAATIYKKDTDTWVLIGDLEA